MLELKSITKRLGDFEMRDINLEIRTGEYFILLGPSGIGKTVLVETIAGIIRPDSGQILWKGNNITYSMPETRGFAVVYQDCALFPHMKVAQNVVYGLKFRADRSTKLSRIAESVGIMSLLDRYPNGLSGGEKQRIAIARALMTEPELLLLDEPLSSLDEGTRREFRTELKRVHKEFGKTVLHVTHDLDEAMSLGDRIGIMLGGRVHQCGTPEELFNKPSDRDIAEFLGMRNVIPVSYVDEGLCKAGALRIHVAEASEGTSYVWIRPEEIVLSKEPFSSSARNQFQGVVIDWERSGPLFAARLATDGLTLTALITYGSFRELSIQPGAELYITFKSSSVHQF